MDGPDVPNPTNPNAQDQFVDLVQGPTNQGQGPAVQNQAQGPANNNAQVGQMYPCSLHNNCPQHNQSPLVW